MLSVVLAVLGGLVFLSAVSIYCALVLAKKTDHMILDGPDD